MNTTGRLSPEQVASLGKYDTPTICNAIELFDIRPRTAGYMDGNIRCCFPDLPPMVGYASTAQFSAAKKSGQGDVYQKICRQIENMAELGVPSVVVFEDLDSPSVAATFGEVLCSTYKAFGAAGLITSGAGRDIDQVERIAFPAFVGSVMCAHGYCTIVATDTPVRVGGISVGPLDLLHGDRNGVTMIPHEIARELPDVCAEYMHAEQVVLDYLKSNSVTPKGYKKAVNESKRRLQTLRESLHRK